MLLDKKILVIIPFFNEEKKIEQVLITLPDFIDYVVLIDDGSTDNSLEIVWKTINKKIISKKQFLIISEGENIMKVRGKYKPYYIVYKHSYKKGKGYGIQSGYHIAKKTDAFCVATMDGDGQMAPNELIKLCLPIVKNKVDYAKGNRLSHPNAFKIFPFTRYIGLKVLTFLNKFSSGYYHVNDSQTGFTAISNKTLNKINISNLYKEYGYPNDMLTRLNLIGAKVLDIDVTPIYPKEGESKMRILDVIPKISFLLLKLFFIRVWRKYFAG